MFALYVLQCDVLFRISSVIGVALARGCCVVCVTESVRVVDNLLSLLWYAHCRYTIPSITIVP